MSLHAQEFTPILNSNAVWTQGVSGGWPNGTVTYAYKKMSLQGDTTINGITYQKMYSTPNELQFNPNNANYEFSIREASNGKIWIIRQQDDAEILYMDMSLDVGETAFVFGNNFFVNSDLAEALVLAKDSFLIGNEYRTRLQVQLLPENQFCITEYWIEGLGNLGGFLRDLAPCFVSDIGYQVLICHEIENELDYQAPWASSCSLPYPLGINDFVFQDETICAGQQIEIGDIFLLNGGVGPYSFSVEPDIGVVQANNFGVTVNPTETTDYTYIVTDVLGNTESADFTIFVIDDPIEPASIVVSSFSDDCYVDSLLLFSENSYDSYMWTNINGNIVGNEQALVIYEPGNYYLEVFNISGCSSTDVQAFLFQDPLNTNPNPEIIIEPTERCVGDVITISTKESYDSYVWSNGETTPTISFILEEGFHSIGVQVTNEFGCVGPNIPTSIGFSGTIYAEEPVILQEGNVLTALSIETIGWYQWFLNGEPIEGATEMTYEATTSGEYSVAVSLSSFDLLCEAYSETLPIVLNDRPVAINVFLEGVYDPATGLMTTHLLADNLIPLSQPYDSAPWNYNGDESVASYSDFPVNTVDWVLIEARIGTPDLIVASTTEVETRAALLLADGTVVAPDGNMLQFSNLGPGPYNMVVRHRNHLDIISSAPSTGNATIFHDFTYNVNEAFGFEQLKEMTDGRFAMFVGDYNPNGVIQTTDYDEWILEPALNQIYIPTDGNLDGIVQATDYDRWFFNKAKLGVIEIQY